MKKITLLYPGGHSGMGFGDYLAGCLGLTEWGFQHSVEIGYRIEDHPISKFYEFKSEPEPPFNINLYSNTIIDSFLEEFLADPIDRHIGLVSNWNPYTSYSPLTLAKVKEILQPSLELSKKTEKFLETVQNYKILHIRLDDMQFIKPTMHASTIQEYVLSSKVEGPFIVLSNNTDIKEELQQKEGWAMYECEPIHFGNTQYQEGNILDTCVELELLKQASHIYQFSVYNWPSNFSKRISEIYEIPLTYIPIENETSSIYEQRGESFEYHNK